MVVVERTPASKQEWLDVLVSKSKAGKFPSMKRYDHNNAVCLYRAEGGVACAVGLLIPDDQYDPRMDADASGNSLTLDHSLEIIGFQIPEWTNYEELQEAQRIHDSIALSVGLALFVGWNHELFLARIKESKVFQGMQPTGGW